MNREKRDNVIEMDGEKPNTFWNPDVDESIVESVVRYFKTHGKSYPWDVICFVSEAEDVPKKTVREAIRKLRGCDIVVHAEPFVGEFILSENLE